MVVLTSSTVAVKLTANLRIFWYVARLKWEPHEAHVAAERQMCNWDATRMPASPRESNSACFSLGSACRASRSVKRSTLVTLEVDQTAIDEQFGACGVSGISGECEGLVEGRFEIASETEDAALLAMPFGHGQFGGRSATFRHGGPGKDVAVLTYGMPTAGQ